MKNYLFISNTDYSKNQLTGAHKRFLELVNSFSENSKVTLITTNGCEDKLLNKGNIMFIPFEYNCPCWVPKHIYGALSIFFKLMKINHKNIYDAAISFGPVSTLVYWFSGYSNIVSLFREDLINYAVVNRSNKLRLIYLKLQELLSVLASKKIIVQCKNDKLNLIARTKKYYKTIDKKVVIQTNNCNAFWMSNEVHRNGIYNDIPKILFVGDFSSPRKGHHLLFPAVAKLLDEGIKCELYVCGDGKTKNEWQDRYKSYKQIIFCGYVKTDDYLTNCDFMIVPSLIDSCPNTVLEALNIGLAVYGANTGGIPDLLKEDKYLFEPNIESIYEFLKNVIQNRKFVEDAKHQTKQKKLLTFDWGMKILNLV